MLLERRAQMFRHGRLPSGFIECEWIEGTGTQYIDTLVVPSAQHIISMDAAMMVTSGSNCGEGILESIGSNNARLHTIYATNGSKLSIWSGVNTSTRTYEISDSTFATHTIVFSHNRAEIDGAGAACTTPTNLTNSFYLFKRHKSNGEDTWTGKIRKSYCRIRDASNELVRDFVPCYRSNDGVIGMYDLCGSICPLTGSPFYINAGTGIFTKGADV